jgi:hypothetical protein
VYNIPSGTDPKQLQALLRQIFPQILSISRIRDSRIRGTQAVTLRLLNTNAKETLSSLISSEAHKELVINGSKLMVSRYGWNPAPPRPGEVVGKELRLKLMPGYHILEFESILRETFEPLELKGNWHLPRLNKTKYFWAWNEIQAIEFEHESDADKVLDTFGEDAINSGAGRELKYAGFKVWVGRPNRPKQGMSKIDIYEESLI